MPGASPSLTDTMQFPAIPPLVVYAVFLVGFVVTTLLAAHLIGPRKKTPIKQMPYESGMDPVGDARQPYNVRFYLVAILFLIFDVELLFLYPWAVTAYGSLPAAEGSDAVAIAGLPPELSGPVFVVMNVFLGTLAIAYVYAWRKGVFQWR